MHPIAVLRRLITVGLSALVAAALLVLLTGWVALQADWRLPPPDQLSAPTVVLARDGTVLARFTSEVDRRPVPLEEVAPEVVDALIAAEDERFFEHRGVDPISLVRAVIRNVLTGSITQGGSTLTQQYVRNAYSAVGRERTLIRKVREAVASIQLERDLSKEEILERYLNTVYFGEGAYGIEAAALTFFGRSARDLGPAEAAALVQALPAPSVRNPRVDPVGARQRRDHILDRMLALGMLSREEHDRAVAQPLEVLPPRTPQFPHPYFVEYVRKQLVHAYGSQAVLTGGLVVRTTIDLEVQRAIEEAVAEVLPPQEGENADVDAGVVAIDPRTGDILGIYGGRDFLADQLDLATQGRRQNGSTFKPFGFIAALEAGIPPTRRYQAPGRITIPPDRCVGYDGTRPIEVRGGPGGELTLREGLIRSVNTVFIQVGCELGASRIVEVAARMGVRNVISDNPAVAIGGPAFGASVLDMASAFATLANDGRYCPARSILEVRGPDGQLLDPPQEVTVVPDMPVRTRALTAEELAARPEGLAAFDRGRCVGAVEPDIARITTAALEEVVARTTGRRAQIGRPQAGKTGTANDERDAWFVGYTPDLAMAVWVGHRSSNAPLRNVAGFARVQGGTVPALIWRAAAQRILADVPPTAFLRPGELAVEEGRRPGPARTPSPTPSPTSPSPSPDTPSPRTPPSEPSPQPTRPSPTQGPCLLIFC